MRRGAHVPAPSGRDSAGSRLLTAIGVVLLLCGAALLFLPLAQNVASQASMDREIGLVQDVRAAGGEDGDPAPAGDAPSASTAGLDAAREWLEQYNRRVASGEVSIAADPFSLEEALGSFGSQGLEDGLVGYIEIPRMGVSLPLYLGATSEHMAKGAAVVSGSSAPLGGESANCVVAAHRGYRYAAMFRDIEELSAGDAVHVSTLWGELDYTVVNTKVISPSDTAAVGVQQGRDMLSLLTCHPYGHNYSRYIVECERGDGGSAAQGADAGADSGASTSGQASGGDVLGIPLPRAENYLRAIGAALLALSAVVLLFRRIRGS